jgi:lysozyme
MTECRKINQVGLDLLKQLEGCKLQSYPDPGSELAKRCFEARFTIYEYSLMPDWKDFDGSPWTVGYGSTQINHPEIVPGLTINQEQAELYLKQDLEKFYVLDNYCSDHVNDNQYSALICLAYNVGLRAVRNSNTLRLCNEGLPPDTEWKGFNKTGGEVNAGLVNRREAELKLYHTLS